MLFLKWLDDYEKDRETAAKLDGKTYTRIISNKFRWTVWAVPKNAKGEIDYNAALTGEDLKRFVDASCKQYD